MQYIEGNTIHGKLFIANEPNITSGSFTGSFAKVGIAADNSD